MRDMRDIPAFFFLLLLFSGSDLNAGNHGTHKKVRNKKDIAPPRWSGASPPSGLPFC
jgi:hypothetical protein